MEVASRPITTRSSCMEPSADTILSDNSLAPPRLFCTEKLEAGEITREDYDRWRYNYPKYDTTHRWAKVPSKELSDFLVEAFRDRLDIDE